MPPTGNVTDPQDVSPASKKAAAKAQRELSTTKRAAQNRAAQVRLLFAPRLLDV